MTYKFLHEPGRFYLEDDAGATIAEIDYAESDTPKVWTIDHTFVAPALRGAGMAGQLLDRLAEEARAQHVKLKPVCAYAKAAFTRDAKYDDVSAESSE
ncbi:N-acetyltransferase [Weissella viridescens]|uniref:N-acetyltransferase n=1 Tax=Weissella viridescens TaxID=1629 RepID=A0A3P2RLZ3_WEIVI|nr:GNAT family N-acetyltransferase [Weissella viridescens]RRG18692.1 N-acetyltransferase [Weissella viridescens]